MMLSSPTRALGWGAACPRGPLQWAERLPDLLLRGRSHVQPWPGITLLVKRPNCFLCFLLMFHSLLKLKDKLRL